MKPPNTVATFRRANLPQHKPQQTLSLPLIYEGMSVWEVAAWHSYCRKNNDRAECLKIEKVVEKMPPCDRRLIGMLDYYVPVKK